MESETDWDFAWADVGWVHQHILEERMPLADQQRINHFPSECCLPRLWSFGLLQYPDLFSLGPVQITTS